MGMEVPGENGEKDRSGGGWTTPGTTCRRDNCQGRPRKTGLNVGKYAEEEEEEEEEEKKKKKKK